DVLEREGHNSFHIVNYNSPGATGAPAFSALVVQKLQNKGILKDPNPQKNSLWNFNSIIEQI
ncbi:MAG: FAD-dependent oxidoreductase, partial [Candidatus Nitrosopelagicus sp.]|nr:FAD-dependent oxidoreductase [Candidatus Nitrosopelagicus sp.]